MIINFRTLNNKLLSRIGNRKTSKSQLKVLNDIFKAYENKMKKNSNDFFKNNIEGGEDFNKYTLNSIRNRITTHILDGKFNEEVLRKQLINLIKYSREFQKQKLIVNKTIKEIKELPDSVKYDYIITHPVLNDSNHSDECRRRKSEAINGVSREIALKESKNLPQHNKCTCKYVPRIDKNNVLINQDNF